MASFANLLLFPLSLTSDVLAILGTEKKTDILKLLLMKLPMSFAMAHIPSNAFC